MTVKATQFRQNLFQILDQCRDTGEKVRIERGGEVYELVPKRKKLRIEELECQPFHTTFTPRKGGSPFRRTWDWDALSRRSGSRPSMLGCFSTWY